MDKELVKFSSQADAAILQTIKTIAQEEGRQFQSVLDEAFHDFIEKKQQFKPSKQIMDALAESMREYDHLYKKLAE